ncbi:hypothetical protein PRIEUP_LOCUS14972 [Pristimantis euphronides]
MKMLGLLTSCISSVPWGQFHTRHLQSWMLTTWDRKQTSLDSRALVPEGVKNSLIWWTKITNLGKGVPWNLNPQVVITTDASHLGWGAHVQKRYIQGRWPPHIQRRSSNFRELRAVWEALKASQPILTGTHVKVLSDNMTAVALLRHQGATKHPTLQALALKIFIWAEKVVQSILAIHLRGSENQEADFFEPQQNRPGGVEPETASFQLLSGQVGQTRGEKSVKSHDCAMDEVCYPENLRITKLVPPSGIKAHSTRAVSTSWAEKAEASVDQICKAATWRNIHTFYKHYRLDLNSVYDLSFGRKVLQAVIPP